MEGYSQHLVERAGEFGNDNVTPYAMENEKRLESILSLLLMKFQVTSTAGDMTRQRMSIFISSEPCGTYIALEVITSPFLSGTFRGRGLEGILNYRECEGSENAFGKAENREEITSTYDVCCPFEIPSFSWYIVSVMAQRK